ncbi:PAN domain-containing protein [Bradyrhizobium paxllaeri]|uniref:PAN domain-containing protein n=1 Tax=Bradyrhizobium paxllaeri TaxID=190148 RepID=UPI0009FBD760|nr:PAN domain-containing protein [Bradyrhizobium paxllaeri]
MYLRSLIFASAFIITFSGIAGTALAQGDVSRSNTDRPGNDFRNIALRGNAADCRNLCLRAPACRAWTFVKPGFQGPSARCYLKNPTPPAFANACCTSGIARVAFD